MSKEQKHMTPEQFVYWLQGFAELSETSGLSPRQWQVIKDHLQLVFNKVTPDRKVDENPIQSPITWPEYPVVPGYEVPFPPQWICSTNTLDPHRDEVRYCSSVDNNLACSCTVAHTESDKSLD